MTFGSSGGLAEALLYSEYRDHYLIFGVYMVFLEKSAHKNAHSYKRNTVAPVAVFLLRTVRIPAAYDISVVRVS